MIPRILSLLLASTLCHRIFALDNGLAVNTPPMGLSTWSVFRGDINHSMIVELADSMVELGLKDAGYTYLFMDAGWTSDVPYCQNCLSHRNETGLLHVDPAKFPNLTETVEYVHGQGLLFGIWYGFEMCDDATFANADHDYAHYAALDANYFAFLGVDALKHDICNAVVPNTTEGRSHNFAKFETFGNAMNATGRPILYDVSLIVSKPRETPAYDYNYIYSPEPYGEENVRSVANMWWSVPVNKFNCWKCCVHPQEFIVDDDEACNDPNKLPAWRGLLPILDVQDMQTPGWQGHWSWAGHGKGWNHLDQLSSCMGKSWYGPGLTPSEQVAQISLWAIMASPLVIPPDIRKVQKGDFCHSLISNPKMLQVHQDRLGEPGYPAKKFVGTNGEITGQIWIRGLSNGALAVLFFNRSEKRQLMECKWEAYVGLLKNSTVGEVSRSHIANVWTDEIRQHATSPLVVSVEPHAVSFWILSFSETNDVVEEAVSRRTVGRETE